MRQPSPKSVVSHSTPGEWVRLLTRHPRHDPPTQAQLNFISKMKSKIRENLCETGPCKPTTRLGASRIIDRLLPLYEVLQAEFVWGDDWGDSD
jgi:hypothetical protein